MPDEHNNHNTPIPLSDEAVREIAARAAAASLGPWSNAGLRNIRYEGGGRERLWYIGVGHPCGLWEAVTAKVEADAAFIAAARTDIPALCATVEAQARRIEALEAIGRHGELAESYLDEREGESGGYGPGWYITCERCNSSTYIGPDPPTTVTSMLIQHEASCVYAFLTPTTDDGEEV